MICNAPIVRSLVCLIALNLVLAGSTGHLRAGVFGDGDPANGTEDSRVPLTSMSRRDEGWETWNLSAGTIHCDGRLRGSASILDTAGMGFETTGLVLLTAAHVLFDLDAHRPFKSCRLHYMGLDQVPGYQQPIDLSLAILGDFDSRQPRHGRGFGREDWAVLYVAGPVPASLHTGPLVPKPYARLPAAAGQPFSFRVLGWNDEQQAIHISGPCRVRESVASDLGGGAWSGQLLDDCDSGQGASGGGLVAARGGERYLVGIRSGAHWHPTAFPAVQYPGGPPHGSRWDVMTNTNYSRAIDTEILGALQRLLEDVRQNGSR